MFWLFGKFKSSRLPAGLLTGPALPEFRRGEQVGFTMLELLVVISIFLFITGVVIADIPNFRNKSSLDLITSEVATYVRGAQIYGATQKGGSNSDGNVSYGINFNLDNGSTFFLFKNDSGNPPEESYDIQGFKVTRIIVRRPSGDDVYPSEVDIIFRANDYTSTIGTQLEPEVEADRSPQSDFNQVDIEIRPDRDQNLCKIVRVYRNGQVAPVAPEACN